MPHHLYSIFIRLPKPIRILIITMTVIIFFGIIISFIEPETFKTVFDGLWWAIITASTVGYGDFAPKTVLGRVTGIVLIIFGAGFLSAFLYSLATLAVSRQSDFIEGKASFKGSKHYIVIGWNERSKEIIEKLLNMKNVPSIVLIDHSLQANPLKDFHVQFIKGRAASDDVLLKAKVDEAEKVVITADPNKGEYESDMVTILTLLAIKGLNQKVSCVAEILTAEQVTNAKRAGADEIIQTNKIASSIMANCLFKQGGVEPLLNLLEELDGSKMAFRSAASFKGKNFKEAAEELLAEEIVLLGIKRGLDTIVNPPNNFQIKEHDLLLIMK